MFHNKGQTVQLHHPCLLLSKQKRKTIPIYEPQKLKIKNENQLRRKETKSEKCRENTSKRCCSKCFSLATTNSYISKRVDIQSVHLVHYDCHAVTYSLYVPELNMIIGGQSLHGSKKKLQKSEYKIIKPVLIEVGIDSGNGSVFDVGRCREVGKSFGEVDGVASLGKMREFLNW